MRIDSHQHFWKYDAVRDSWIDTTMEVIRRDFLPNDLMPILKEYDMNGCIAVQADQSEMETEFLLHLAEQNTGIKGVVGWVDLCADTVKERLTYFSKNKLFKGVRHILQSESDDFMLAKDFQKGIAALGKLKLTYDILVYPNQLKNVNQLVAAFPNQLFVLDHLSKPPIKSGKFNEWKRDILTLAQYANVYCKISGMLTEADWKNWKSEDFTPYLDIVFKAFGTDRLLFGSDWPVCLLAGQYGAVVEVVENYLKAFSQEEQIAVMGINACNFYNLEGKTKTLWI